MKAPKVALVHDYLSQYGGAEKTLEALIDLFPDAPIYTGIYNPTNLSEKINKQKIILPPYKNNLLIGIIPQKLTFLMSMVFETFDLSEYDIIISDGTTYAKGVITKPNQLHISYIHTPPRFLYGYTVESLKHQNPILKPFIMLMHYYLRTWDYIAAQRPDYLITNSITTSKRINKFYRRDAVVINPPVELVDSELDNQLKEQQYFLTINRFSAYKNYDLLIDSFNKTQHTLFIIGTGKEEDRIKAKAGPNIKFLGRVSDEEKHKYLKNAKGFIFSTEEEDFGMVMAEATSHGIPVLAHKSGGALEIIRENIDGMFFEKIDIDHFIKKLEDFNESIDKNLFDANTIRDHAKIFSQNIFKEKFYSFVMEKWQKT